MAKYTYEEVQDIFRKVNCELISTEYKNNKTNLEYRCSCGKIGKVRLDSFLRGSRCKECGKNKSSESRKLSYKSVASIFENAGLILISKKYENNYQLLDYVCTCGKVSKISLLGVRQGQKCMKCGIERRSTQRRLDYSYVREFFEKENCKLIDNSYEGIHSKLKYICQCGNRTEINFNNFRRGQRCKECGFKKLTGENHPRYNFNLTDEERIVGRNYHDYFVWRKEVYRRDGYTCQHCGEKKSNEIHAHHIDGYNWCVEKRTDVDNGVTLCEGCHGNFHAKYGYGDNTREQYNEWIRNKREQGA